MQISRFVVPPGSKKKKKSLQQVISNNRKGCVKGVPTRRAVCSACVGEQRKTRRILFVMRYRTWFVCSQFATTHYVTGYKTIHMYYLKKSHDSLNRPCDQSTHR